MYKSTMPWINYDYAGLAQDIYEGYIQCITCAERLQLIGSSLRRHGASKAHEALVQAASELKREPSHVSVAATLASLPPHVAVTTIRSLLEARALGYGVPPHAIPHVYDDLAVSALLASAGVASSKTITRADIPLSQDVITEAIALEIALQPAHIRAGAGDAGRRTEAERRRAAHPGHQACGHVGRADQGLARRAAD